MGRKILLAVLILVVLYLGTGLAFHFKWENELAACREVRAAQGEYVEPPVFAGFIRLGFDMTWWPVYAQANIYHDGTPFATPCTHSGIAVISIEEEEGAVQYAIEICEGRTWADLDSDRLLNLALTRLLEVVGASCTSQAFSARSFFRTPGASPSIR